MQLIQTFLGSPVWIFFFCFSNLYKERHIDPKGIRVRIFTNPFSSFCCDNIAVIGYTVRFRHLSKCQPQMTLWTGNYYDVIFLPKWRTQIWRKIDLGGHIFDWEAIPKDTDLRGKRTRIWGYSDFIGHGFVGKHRFEERTRIWGRTWIWVLHIYAKDELNQCLHTFFYERFQDTKVVIRYRKPKKDRQCNGQK